MTGWPGLAAAIAANGIKAPIDMAKTAASKASERVSDQFSTGGRDTQAV